MVSRYRRRGQDERGNEPASGPAQTPTHGPGHQAHQQKANSASGPCAFASAGGCGTARNTGHDRQRCPQTLPAAAAPSIDCRRSRAPVHSRWTTRRWRSQARRPPVFSAVSTIAGLPGKPRRAAPCARPVGARSAVPARRGLKGRVCFFLSYVLARSSGVDSFRSFSAGLSRPALLPCRDRRPIRGLVYAGGDSLPRLLR